MDFSFSEDQQALVDLTKKLFNELCPPDRIASLEQHAAREAGHVFHAALWRQLAESELLGLGLKPDVGGAELGMLELCLLLEQAGRVTAPIPLVATLCLAAPAVDRFGGAALRASLLPGVVAGTRILCASTQVVSAEQSADNLLLTGQLECVSFAPLATHLVVPAEHGDTLSVVVVDLAAPGVQVVTQRTSSGECQGRINLQAVSVSPEQWLRVETPEGQPAAPQAGGAQILEFMLLRGRLGAAALTLGMCDRALQLTAQYSVERKQFERPIGAFQAVGQRAADAFVDVETMRVVLWRAAWLLDDEQDATDETLVASYWAKEAGQRVVNAAQHIHGGIGFDRDYPLFRYFLGVKHLELRLGSATSCLAELGARLAQN